MTMMLDIFFFCLAVWVCSSIMTAGAIKVERARIMQEVMNLKERERVRKVEALYGRDDE